MIKSKQKYLKIKEVTWAIINSTPNDIIESKYSVSLKLIASYAKKIDCIYEGLLSMAKDANFYVFHGTFRILLEHFIVCRYLQDKISKSDDDFIGLHFQKYKRAKEVREFINSSLKQLELIGAKEIYETEKNNVRNKYPNEFSITKDEYIKETIQYTIKSIIQYFSEELKFKDKEEDIEVPEYEILRYISDYSLLSSFIHGGPTSDDIILSCKNEKNEFKEKIKYAFEIVKGINIINFLLFFKCTGNVKYLELSLLIKSI